MKIGIVETGLPPHHIGGAELQAWSLAKQLAGKHDVTIFTRRSPDTGKYDKISNIRIFRMKPLFCPLGIASYVFGTLYTITAERRRLDLLLCFRAWPNGIIGLLVTLMLRIPTCFSIRGGDWYFVNPYWWGKIIYKLLFASSMPVVVQTKKIRSEIVAEYPAVDPLVIPNGIDIEEEQKVSGRTIVFVGNLIPRKGIDILLEALRGLPKYPLTIIGDGPDRAELGKKAAGLDVQFLGKVQPEKIRKLMAIHGKIFVLPAIAGEGLPNVLLEAMSIGLPVIASDVAGVRDLLDGGNAGMLVEAGNVTSLREAIYCLWNNDRLRNELAESGRREVEKYSWDKVVAGWERLFSKMTYDYVNIV